MYITRAAILSEIPLLHLVEALDDDGDGLEDPNAFERVEFSAETEIDGILGQRYQVPFVTPYPAIVTNAARVIVLEKLYQRRGIPSDKNPWTKQASDVRTQLKGIALGKEPLTPESKKVNRAVDPITEPSKTTLRNGGILA